MNGLVNISETFKKWNWILSDSKGAFKIYPITTGNKMKIQFEGDTQEFMILVRGLVPTAKDDFVPPSAPSAKNDVTPVRATSNKRETVPASDMGSHPEANSLLNIFKAMRIADIMCILLGFQNANNTVAGIRYIRKLTKLPLKEAKDIYEGKALFHTSYLPDVRSPEEYTPLLK